MAVLGGNVNRRSAAVVALVDVAARSQQQLQALGVAVVSCKENAVIFFEVAAGRQQRCQASCISVLRSVPNTVVPVTAGSVDVSSRGCSGGDITRLPPVSSSLHHYTFSIHILFVHTLQHQTPTGQKLQAREFLLRRPSSSAAKGFLQKPQPFTMALPQRPAL